jgi:hypothetical protein
MPQIGGQQSNVAIQSPKHHHPSSLKETCEPPICPKAHLQGLSIVKNARNLVMQKRIWAWVLLVKKS